MRARGFPVVDKCIYMNDDDDDDFWGCVLLVVKIEMDYLLSSLG